MASPAKVVDPAFEGAGQQEGLEVWRIEDFQPVRVPKSDVGKFYNGDSYIVLKTTILKSGAFQYDVHFWLGKATSQDEAGAAAIKTVELDTILDDRPVQHREVQGHETDKFLSYFKPCIIPLEGGVASGFKKVEKEEFEPQLFTCKGKRFVKVKQVSISRSSLNHDDIFILDTESQIYQFNGSTSSIQERAKALEVVQYIKETNHDGACDVAVIDDGELKEEPNTAEFWKFFGGFGPIGNGSASEESASEVSTGRLYSVENGKLNQLDATTLTRDLLESNKCYVLDCGTEIYIWTGRMTSIEERKAATGSAEELLSSQTRPKHTHVTRIIEGSETLPFCTKFDEWPTISEAEDAPEDEVQASTNEEVPALFNTNGKLELWHVHGPEKTAIASGKAGKFSTGHCYVILYTVPGEQTETYFLCSWLGKRSTKEDQKAALQVAGEIARMHEERPVQVHIVEGNEPPEFLGLFQGFYILKGGSSSAYQTEVAKKGFPEETLLDDEFALFAVEGTGPHNRKAVQISQDITDLDSCSCYIIQNCNACFVWNGGSTSPQTQTVAVDLAKGLKPGSTVEIVQEGSETSEFWDALGGRKSSTCHPKKKNPVKDPCLFACSLVNGKLEATEVFDFSQNDLLTEDVMLLDACNEVFVWIGKNADSKEKQQAFDMGQKYVERAASVGGLMSTVPIYTVTEGNEPFFFCKHFKEWDVSQASMQGNSFQKRFSSLFGRPNKNSKTVVDSKRDVTDLSSTLSGCKIADSASSAVSTTRDKGESEDVGEHFSYERLKASSDDPAPGVDPERREAYLSPEEFKELFGMDSHQFYELPKWRQEKHKKAHDLF